MAFIAGAPHPAWVVLLTIPVWEWVVHSISWAYRRRKKAKREQDETIKVDVAEASTYKVGAAEAAPVEAEGNNA
jgi:uncharacterized membrane protein